MPSGAAAEEPGDAVWALGGASHVLALRASAAQRARAREGCASNQSPQSVVSSLESCGHNGRIKHIYVNSIDIHKILIIINSSMYTYCVFIL